MSEQMIMISVGIIVVAVLFVVVFKGVCTYSLKKQIIEKSGSASEALHIMQNMKRPSQEQLTDQPLAIRIGNSWVRILGEIPPELLDVDKEDIKYG